MAISERDFEWNVVDTLIQLGYPSDSIATEWRSKTHIYDIVVLDSETHLPLMVIECKHNISKTSINNAFEQLSRIRNDFDYPVRLCAAIYRDELGFDFYDFTNKINHNDNSLEGISTTEVPAYRLLKVGARSKQEKVNKAKRKRYINGLKIVCWLIIPALIIASLYLDIKGIYPYTTERIIIYGFLLLSILIPFFGEIRIGEITFIPSKRTKKEEQKEDA